MISVVIFRPYLDPKTGHQKCRAYPVQLASLEALPSALDEIRRKEAEEGNVDE